MQYNGAKIVLQPMVLEQVDIHMQKQTKSTLSLDTDLIVFVKMNSKQGSSGRVPF
jgi:hypothetical protein